MDPDFLAQIKQFEGFTPKAQWDYSQYSNGYGTKALAPGEVINEQEGHRRLVNELGQAQGLVDKFAPNLPPGVRNALTSLTMNSGTRWQDAGLGAAVQAGNWQAAAQRIMDYNKAGGKELPGLTYRRGVEAGWITGQGPTGAVSRGLSAPPGGGAPTVPNLGTSQDAAPDNSLAELAQTFAQQQAQRDEEDKPKQPVAPMQMLPGTPAQIRARLAQLMGAEPNPFPGAISTRLQDLLSGGNSSSA